VTKIVHSSTNKVTQEFCVISLIHYFLCWKHLIHRMITSAFLMDAPYLRLGITLNNTLKSFFSVVSHKLLGYSRGPTY